ncbi:MAG: hypothetical protein P4L51_23580 [Puia sp.]|nr:hypothetical protein [Puia sp.]
MSIDSFQFDAVEWGIQPIREEHLPEIAEWINAIGRHRGLNPNLIAAQMLNEHQIAVKGGYIDYYVGTRSGQLIFYFNGYCKDRKGALPGKIHKKKDYSLSLIVNTLVPGYAGFYAEIWFRVLFFVFQKPNVGRILTEIDPTDELLTKSLSKLGFHKMNKHEAPQYSPGWLVCNRTDFAPLAAL